MKSRDDKEWKPGDTGPDPDDTSLSDDEEDVEISRQYKDILRNPRST